MSLFCRPNRLPLSNVLLPPVFVTGQDTRVDEINIVGQNANFVVKNVTNGATVKTLVLPNVGTGGASVIRAIGPITIAAGGELINVITGFATALILDSPVNQVITIINQNTTLISDYELQAGINTLQLAYDYTTEIEIVGNSSPINLIYYYGSKVF